MDFIVEMRFGSQLYGTATPLSDLDYKAHLKSRSSGHRSPPPSTRRERGMMARERFELKIILISA
jgi:hypothetical protein